MKSFNCNTDFCRQCGMDGELCKNCEKKKCYEQGRADKYKEITSEYMLLTEEQVQEIKADAVDELVDRCNKYCGDECYGECFDCHLLMVNEIAEELKEQKNE